MIAAVDQLKLDETMTDWHDTRPIDWAASYGNFDVVSLLIRRGAKVDADVGF